MSNTMNYARGMSLSTCKLVLSYIFKSEFLKVKKDKIGKTFEVILIAPSGASETENLKDKIKDFNRHFKAPLTFILIPQNIIENGQF